MKNRSTEALAVLAVAALLSIPLSCSERPAATPAQITLTGRIAIIGNEPLTQLAVVTADEKVYELEGEKTAELRELQGATLRLQGRLLGTKGRYADRFEVTLWERVK